MGVPALFLVAHGGGGGHSHAGEIGLAAIAIAAMVIPLVVLALIGRAFWRAAKRDEKSEREAGAKTG